MLGFSLKCHDCCVVSSYYGWEIYVMPFDFVDIIHSPGHKPSWHIYQGGYDKDTVKKAFFYFFIMERMTVFGVSSKVQPRTVCSTSSNLTWESDIHGSHLLLLPAFIFLPPPLLQLISPFAFFSTQQYSLPFPTFPLRRSSLLFLLTSVVLAPVSLLSSSLFSFSSPFCLH